MRSPTLTTGRFALPGLLPPRNGIVRHVELTGRIFGLLIRLQNRHRAISCKAVMTATPVLVQFASATIFIRRNAMLAFLNR